MNPFMELMVLVNITSTDPTKSQQTRDPQAMLVQGWASVADAGPTLNQHWCSIFAGILPAYGHNDP